MIFLHCKIILVEL